MKKLFYSILIISFSISLKAQDKKVLFTINDKPYYTDEFTRVYNKNLDLVKDDSQKDLNNYLELFIGYKLKVIKANALGLQYNEIYKNELKSYRSQLAKKYINDSQVTDKLLKEAYNRIKTEVRASHILILVDESASPEDTLKAYNKIVDIKKKITGGLDFEKAAMQYSEDPSAKENKGDVGYFSAFRMVYPFESAAYNTNLNTISNPVRTKFGYHIVKPTDSRENKGEIEVAHIMFLKSDDKVANEKAKQSINDINKKIQQGESFESLAVQFSEDKASGPKGGVLQRFGSGQLASQIFEDAAFSLDKKNDISKPFESEFGWHIVKLINKYPIESYDVIKESLNAKVSKDERSFLITNSLATKLKSKYKIVRDEIVFAEIKKAVTDEFYSQTWNVPAAFQNYSKNLITIEKYAINGSSFLNYIFSYQKANLQIKPIFKLVDYLYEKWVDEQLISYYDANLESEFPEFSYVVDEYRDGLLLFDLMDKEIWTRAKTDTLALKAYLKNNQQNYMWKKRYDTDIFSSTNKKAIDKAKSYIKKGKSVDYIKSMLNKDDKVEIMVKSGLFEEDYEVLPDFSINFLGATDVIEKGSYYFVANIKSILPIQPKTIQESRVKLVNDFQTYLDENWVGELKKEFDVKVNEAVFNELKNNLNK